MAIDNVVLALRADVEDVRRKLLSIQRLNTALAQKMGADFTKGFTVLNNQLKKVEFDKKFTVKTDDKKLIKTTGTLRTFETTVRSADGQIFKFTESLGASKKAQGTVASSLTKVNEAQNKLLNTSSKLTTNFSNLQSVNTQFNKQLKGVGQVSNFVGTSLNQVTDSGSRVSKIFETTNGKFVQLTETTKRLPNGIQKVDRSIKQLSKSQAQNISTLEGTTRASKTLGQNLANLAKRALLTIPVWFAIRQGISSVYRTIREGLGAIVSFDKALQKARRNLQGSAEEITKNFGRLRSEVTKLSLETGKSVEDITSAFQKFATVGFDFETSLAGANNATKLSILLFGNAEETATAFARSMRVLVDESDDARPASEQLAEVMALTAELWKTNAFELNELTQSLEKFAPVAKTAGFSAEETVKVLSALSTAGLRGSRAGRLLRTSIARLVTSTDKLARSLGVDVNPEVDRTFDVFLRTLDVLAKTRNEAGKVAPEFERVVKSIFGLRSSDAIKGLVALRRNLQQVLGVTGDVSKFNKEFKDVNETVFQLVARFRNLNREIGKAFVIGLVGGNDFQDSLKDIVELQKEILADAKNLGNAFRNIAKTIDILFQIPTLGFGKLDFTTIEDVRKNYDKVFTEINKKGQEEFDKLIKGINGELNQIELERLIIEVKTKIRLSEKNIDIDPNKNLPRVLTVLQNLFDDLPPLEPEVKLSLKGIELSTEQQNKLIEELIKDQLERAKIEGATEVQLLKIEDSLRKQYDANDDIIAQKQRQLEIERQITEEQKDRISFSDESVKLAEIAKTEGIATAEAIGELLQNQRDYNTFLRQGGERVKVLKENFPDFVQTKGLENFFKGIRTPGEEFIRGGERIPISELPQRDFTPIRAKFELERKKIELGLIQATEKNTQAVNSLSSQIQSLSKGGIQAPRAEELAEDPRIAKANIEILQANERLANLINKSTELRQIGQTRESRTDINLVLDGKNIRFTTGSPSETRLVLETMLSDPKVIDTLVTNIHFKTEVQKEIIEPF